MSKIDWDRAYCFWKGCELVEDTILKGLNYYNTKFLKDEYDLPKQTLPPKVDLDVKYKDCMKALEENGILQDEVKYLVGDWTFTIHEAVEHELGDYLEAEYEVSRKRLDKYLENFNNVKLKGVNLHAINHSNGQADWYDGSKLILTSVENLNGNGNFTIKNHWRK